jgi:glycogen synthase
VNPNPLRICILSHEYPPDTGWGGIATFAYHLAHGLVEIGHEVEVITLAKGEAKEVVEGGLRVHRVSPYLKENELCLLGRALPYSRVIFNWSPALWKKLIERHEARPFDVIDSPELLGESILAAMTRVAPLLIRLYTPHFKFVAEKFHNISATFDHRFITMVERIAILQADAITSPSRDLAEFVAADCNYPLEKIALIANPIDATEFCPDGPKAIDSPDLLKVLFVGRLEERKGIKYLVDAVPEIVRAVPNAQFYIVGDDTKTEAKHTSVLAKLKQSIRQAGCQDKVTFINRVPLSELPALYRSADVCVVPSLYDNSPYTCLESMACGRVVIGSKAGGIREYLEDGESGILIEPKSASAIAEAVIRVLQNVDERLRLGKNARLRVIEKFQRSEIARQTVDLYRQTIVRFNSFRAMPLYNRDNGKILTDVDDMAASFNIMLHELLLSQSLRYRAAHWLHQMKTRPKLFFAESVLRSLRKFFPRKDDRIGGRSPIDWLEQQVRLKHQTILESGRLSTLDRQLER